MPYIEKYDQVIVNL